MNAHVMPPLDTSAFRPEQQAFCAELLPRVSRTFALSIEALPESLCDAVRVAYLLCRVVDTIEDEPHLDPVVRNHLFDLFDAAMRDDTATLDTFEQACSAASLGGDSPDAELVAGASSVFAIYRALPAVQREAIRPHVLEMSQGMREYASRADHHERGLLRLSDLADLERYCYFVAGTVGNLLTPLFELEVPSATEAQRTRARERAVSFGLGLQMVNIVKDVATDLERDVCFLPEALAAEHGVALSQILDPALRPQALAVVHAVCACARKHLVAAQEYTLAWPAGAGREVRLFCAVPLVLALATLREVEQGSDTLRPGYVPKVSREVVREVLERAYDAVDTDEALELFFADYGGGLGARD